MFVTALGSSMELRTISIERESTSTAFSAAVPSGMTTRALELLLAVTRHPIASRTIAKCARKKGKRRDETRLFPPTRWKIRGTRMIAEQTMLTHSAATRR